MGTSNNYKTDLEYIDFCNNNPNDIKCKCIIQDKNKKKLQINNLSSYYCWDKSCFDKNSYITSQIKYEQKYCNVVICGVNIKNNIDLEDSELNIENNCDNLKNFNNYFIDNSILDTSVNDVYDIPDYFKKTFFFIFGFLTIIFIN